MRQRDTVKGKAELDREAIGCGFRVQGLGFRVLFRLWALPLSCKAIIREGSGRSKQESQIVKVPRKGILVLTKAAAGYVLHGIALVFLLGILCRYSN